MIIDDGCLDRGHRLSIFSSEYNYVGIYSVDAGDKLLTCIVYHSEDLPTISGGNNSGNNNNKKPNIGGTNQNKSPAYKP